MTKKQRNIHLIALIILLMIDGAFLIRQYKISRLNKDLPEKVRIQKGLIGHYKIINQIDNYSFNIPSSLKDIQEIKYSPKRESKGYQFSSLNIRGNSKQNNVIAIVKFKSDTDSTLKEQSKSFFSAFELDANFLENQIGNQDKNMNTIIARRIPRLRNTDASFFQKDNYIYLITCKSEKIINQIVLDGSW